MAVLRINKKEKNFLLLDKSCLNESTLSWGAKGLHAYLMGMRHDWQVRVADLQKHATNGRDSVRGLLKELQKAGYITKAWARDDATGKYSALEYIVHELPQETATSETKGKTCTEGPKTGNPSPANPGTVNPSPENTTLISIDNNKYQNKQGLITAASNTDQFTEAAAAQFYEIDEPCIAELVNKSAINKLMHFVAEDSVISSNLTGNQKKRVNVVVQKLEQAMQIQDAKVLAEEIEYCLLSKRHFTGCGDDFGKKVNAIRAVIMRGEWQRPAGMVIKAQEKPKFELSKLEQDLRESYAEVTHFQKLLVTAKDSMRAGFESIITKTKVKINQLEAERNKALLQQTRPV